MIGPIVIWGCIGVLLVYEVYALVNRKDGDTISAYVWKATLRHPLIPFLLGMLMSHFFWGGWTPPGGSGVTP